MGDFVQPGLGTATSPPTLEQCERLAAVMGFPLLAPALRPPHYEESMRNLHALTQKALDGDEQASKTLAALKARFTT